MSAPGAKRRQRGLPADELADVEWPSAIAQEVPACVRGPVPILSATRRIAKHDQFLTLVAILGPRFIDNIEKGFGAISVGHRL